MCSVSGMSSANDAVVVQNLRLYVSGAGSNSGTGFAKRLGMRTPLRVQINKRKITTQL